MRRKQLNILCIFAAAFIVYGLVWTGLNAMDRTMIGGWRLLSQNNDLLVIEVNEYLASGTDSACRDVGRLVRDLGEKGYRIKIQNWHHKGILTKEWADRALATDGAY